MAFWDLGNTMDLLGRALNLYGDIKAGQQTKSDYARKARAAVAEGRYVESVAELNRQQFIREGAYQQQLKQMEAEQLREQGEQGHDFYMFQANKQRRQELDLISQMKANYGASGVRTTSGSPRLVMDYDEQLSRENLAWNQYHADLFKYRQGQAASISEFEGNQAMRIARDRGDRETRVAQLKKKRLASDAGFYEGQRSWVDEETGINVLGDLFGLGQWYDQSRKASGKKPLLGF